jgi:hypothetical protein
MTNIKLAVPELAVWMFQGTAPPALVLRDFQIQRPRQSSVMRVELSKACSCNVAEMSAREASKVSKAQTLSQACSKVE